MRIAPAAPDMDTSNQPLTSFSHCHQDILLQLLASEMLPALQAAALLADAVAAQTLTLFRDAVPSHHADNENEQRG